MLAECTEQGDANYLSDTCIGEAAPADIATMTASESNENKKALTPSQSSLAAEACTEFEKGIYSLAMKYRRPGHDVEDLVQTACEGILQAARDYKPDAGSSFHTIAALRIRDALRTAVGAKWKENKDPLRGAASFDEPIDDGDSLHDMIGSGLDIEAEYAAQEEAAEIRGALDKLTDEDRALLSLFAVGDSDVEAAQNLEWQVHQTTACRRRQSALDRLADVYYTEAA